MPMPEFPTLTLRKANEAQAVAQAWFKAQGQDTMPTMYEPGHEGPMYVLSLEGFGDWVTDILNDDTVTWPDGVFPEPVNHWCLGLYPAD